MSENLVVNRISDCSKNFKGQIKAGKIEGEVPKTLKEKKCYYQHDWIFCVCNTTYCNSPQYWPLMFARFSHASASSTRRQPGALEGADQMIKMANLNVKMNKDVKKEYRENLRCLVWFSDTVFQEEENPRFYFYNYISTVHRAPPLADALKTTPVLRKPRDWGVSTNYTRTKLYVVEKEPFEDGTHETDTDYRTFPQEIMQDKKNSENALIFGAIGLAVFVIFLIGTIVFLFKICRRVRDHTQFPRVDDFKTQCRYERCFKSPQLPKEFMKVRNSDMKKNDMEAGASIK